MCFNIISKQKSKQTSNILKKNPWPAQEITAKKHKTIMFSKLLDSREKNLFILYLFYIYIYTHVIHIYIYIYVVAVVVVVVSCVFFVVWPCTDWFVSLVLIFGPQGSKNSLQQLALGTWSLDTLWLCQNSYWTWPFIVDLPIKNGDFPLLC